MEWTKEEIEILKKLYPIISNKEIEKKLPNRTRHAISKKASRLKIEELKFSTNNNIQKEKLTFNRICEIAMQYKTKSEFQKNYMRAYTKARKKGWLDEVCKHMIPQSYSTPQLILREITSILFNSIPLYNTRKIIKPYELDIYYSEFKLAFEYNGERWHKKNSDAETRDIKKIKLCKNVGIKLFVIKENKNFKNTTEYIKKFIIKNIVELN